MQSTLDVNNTDLRLIIHDSYYANTTANTFTEESHLQASETMATMSDGAETKDASWYDARCNEAFDYWGPRMDLGRSVQGAGQADNETESKARVDVALEYPFPVVVTPASMRFVIYEQYLEPMSQCSSDERWCSALQEPIYVQVRHYF